MIFNRSRYSANRELSMDYRRISNKIHRLQHDKLEKHPDTKLCTNLFSSVIDYVANMKSCEEIRTCKIFCTSSIASILSTEDTIKEVKNDIENGPVSSVAKSIIDSIEETLHDFDSSKAFYSFLTKSIYVLMDVECFNRPDRFPKEEWQKIYNRIAVSHELMHLHMDLKCTSRNVLLQEEYAYGGMIHWSREEGLTDDEIEDCIITPFGRTLAQNKYFPTEITEDMVKEECKNFVKRFKPIVLEERADGQDDYFEPRFDIEL